MGLMVRVIASANDTAGLMFAPLMPAKTNTSIVIAFPKIKETLVGINHHSKHDGGVRQKWGVPKRHSQTLHLLSATTTHCI
jgi:hypothetical protein